MYFTKNLLGLSKEWQLKYQGRWNQVWRRLSVIWTRLMSLKLCNIPQYYLDLSAFLSVSLCCTNDHSLKRVLSKMGVFRSSVVKTRKQLSAFSKILYGWVDRIPSWMSRFPQVSSIDLTLRNPSNTMIPVRARGHDLVLRHLPLSLRPTQRRRNASGPSLLSFESSLWSFRDCGSRNRR